MAGITRRRVLGHASALPFGSLLVSRTSRAAAPAVSAGFRRCRPSDPDWPSAAQWEELNRQVGGQLIKVRSPLDACRDDPAGAACADLFKHLKNPYYIGEEPGLTETSGWVDAWTSAPSAYAVAARNADDVVASVNFAREHRLRLVVKGGGHSYQGTSNAADSLLIWTRPMDAIKLHDAFVPQGCAARVAPLPAVSLGAGVIWMRAYNAVTTEAGRYVQGGGCATVGVAGLIQGGGFGSFSKNFGLAAASLLEAEIVTADGAVRIANACTEPELFWALKGGGGGSFGVVTRLTLRTHELPDYFGGTFMTIKAQSDTAFRTLIGRFLAFYRDALFNPHWGESVRFGHDNTLDAGMVFQGLDEARAREAWRPFLSWVESAPQDYTLGPERLIAALPARHFWDTDFLTKNVPAFVLHDDRPGAPSGNVFWRSNLGEAGWFLHGYQSAWLPAALLATDSQDRLADALFAASRYWGVALHFNKGLAGAPDEAIAAAGDTATNPAVTEAFALAITATSGPPAFPGIPGHEPDLALARRHAEAIRATMAALLEVVPKAGSYVSESDYFLKDWQRGFWGANYDRLLAAKRRYDPDGLFFVHHGVGSEDWSADGFVRLG